MGNTNSVYVKVENFLVENKVTFDQLVGCGNFWNDMSLDEKSCAIRSHAIAEYQNGNFDGVGEWY